MSKLLLSLVPALVAITTACGPGDAKPATAPAAPACVRGRAVVILRHAEKESTDKDTPLSERGHARARALASMLGTAGVTRLVATQYKRTQQTLAPLAERTSLPVEVREAARPTSVLADELRGAPDGSIVVVATHSNVIPALVNELAGTKLHGVEGDALPENDYSRVVVITEPCGGRPYVLELGSGD